MAGVGEGLGAPLRDMQGLRNPVDVTGDIPARTTSE